MDLSNIESLLTEILDNQKENSNNLKSLEAKVDTGFKEITLKIDTLSKDIGPLVDEEEVFAIQNHLKLTK